MNLNDLIDDNMSSLAKYHLKTKNEKPDSDMEFLRYVKEAELKRTLQRLRKEGKWEAKQWAPI